MEREELKKVREMLINEIKGIVITRGTLDITRNIRILRCYRGMEEPFVRCVAYLDRSDGLIPISGWFRSAVYHITVNEYGEVIICCDISYSGANEICVDDLLDIRDFIKNMSEEDITACNNYDFIEEDEIDEERREEFARECELPWHY